MGSSDIFTLKLNSDGEFVWVKQIGGSDIDVAKSSAIDASGNIYLTGWFKGTTDFDPNPNPADTFNLTSGNSSFDIVVVKLGCGDTTASSITDTAGCEGYTLNGITYNTSGVYIQKLPNVQGCDSTITLNLTIIPIQNITIIQNGNKLGTIEHFVTYQWLLNGQPIIGATDSTYLLTEIGNYQVAVTNSFGCSDTSDIYTVTNVTGIKDVSGLANQIKLFPNPSSDMVYIQSPINVNIEITGIEGRIIRKIKNAQNFSMKSFASGLYLIRIADTNGALIQVVKITKP